MKHVNRFYTSLLLLSLAMTPSTVLAQKAVMDGNKTQQHLPITSHEAWTPLLSTVVNIPRGAAYNCAVTCTSTVNNPVSVLNDEIYYYAAFNTVNPDVTDGCVRSFDFGPDSASPNNLVVATTCFLPSLIGQEIFYCLGRKEVPADNAIVTGTSMHVTCIED